MENSDTDLTPDSTDVEKQTDRQLKDEQCRTVLSPPVVQLTWKNRQTEWQD